MSHLTRGIATVALLAIVATSGWTSGSRADDLTGPGAWMGVKVIALNEGWREQYAYSGAGVRVTEVAEGGPADRIGVVPGDILVAVGSTSLRYAEDLATAHTRVDPSQSVAIVIAKHNGSMMKIRNLDPIPVPGSEATPASAAALTAGADATPAPTSDAPSEITTPAAESTTAPADPTAAAATEPSSAASSEGVPVAAGVAAVAVTATAVVAQDASKDAPKTTEPDQDPLAEFGVQCAPLNKDLASALGVSTEQGVLVLEVKSGASADRVGLKSGDVISAAGSTVVASVEALSSALRSAISAITLHTWRRGDERDVTVSLGAPPTPATAAETAGASDDAVREELQSLRQELEALRAQIAKGSH